MKWLLILALSSFTLSAFAFWELENREDIMAATPKEIAALVKKYPQILKESRYKLPAIKMLHVGIEKYYFQGSQNCDSQSPKLHFKGISFQVCQLAGRAMKCYQSTLKLPADTDPCPAAAN